MGGKFLLGLSIIFFHTEATAAPVDQIDSPIPSAEIVCGFKVFCVAVNHLGIDISSTAGSAVYAPANGIVREATKHKKFGGTVIIEHDATTEVFTSVIGHLDPRTLSVVLGQEIVLGQQIGVVGDTKVNGGYSPHVHWGVRRGAYDSRNYRCVGKNEWTYAGYTNCPEEVIPQWYDPAELIGRRFGDQDSDGFFADVDCDDTNPAIHPLAPEICNYLDDNCDGAADEGFPNLLTPCTVGVGACSNTGVFVCTADFAGTTCSVVPHLPQKEVCINGTDEDCDGTADQGCECNTGDIVACGSDTGECSRGAQTCANGLWGLCLGAISPIAEICQNSLDDDCDGETDELVAPPIQLTNSAGESELPKLAQSNTGFGLVWGDWRDGSSEIYFMKLDEDGESFSAETALTQAAGSAVHPVVASDGTEFSVFWREHDGLDTEIATTRVDDLGAEIADSEQYVTASDGCSEWPHTVWTGTEYGLVWNDCRAGNPAIYFAALNDVGEIIIPDTLVFDSYPSRNPTVAWSGNRFGVVWECDTGGNWEICFAVLDETGNPQGDVIQETASLGISSYPTIAWMDDEFAIVWQDNRHSAFNYEIYIRFADESGNAIGNEIRVTNSAGHSTYPQIAWSGTELGVTWRDDRDGDGEIYYTTIDPGGALGTEYKMTDNANTDAYPYIVWDGSRFRLVWSGYVAAGNSEVFTASILCSDE